MHAPSYTLDIFPIDTLHCAFTNISLSQPTMYLFADDTLCCSFMHSSLTLPQRICFPMTPCPTLSRTRHTQVSVAAWHGNRLYLAPIGRVDGAAANEVLARINSSWEPFVPSKQARKQSVQAQNTDMAHPIATHRLRPPRASPGVGRHAALRTSYGPRVCFQCTSGAGGRRRRVVGNIPSKYVE